MAIRLAGHGEDLPDNSDINVTPFIDVMLVLLIIFMVAAPLATVDIKVDLPAVSAEPSARPDEPVYLSIEADNWMALGDRRVTHEALGDTLRSVTNGDRSRRIFVRADKSVTYEVIMDAMDHLRSAGYLKVALVGMEARVDH